MQNAYIVGSIGLCLLLSACGDESFSTQVSATLQNQESTVESTENSTGTASTASTTSSQDDVSASNSSPSLSLVGSSTVVVAINSLFTDPGVSAVDLEDGDLTNFVDVLSNVDTTAPGDYSVRYVVTDSDGNTVSVERTVTVSGNVYVNYPVSWESEFDQPDQDSEGWSQLQPSEDSIILYVSSSEGNDTTGAIYSASDSVVGSDPFHPSGTILPFATIEAAVEHMRRGYADYVLLKRGDVWYPTADEIVIDQPGADDNRAVLGAYGDISNDRPLIVNKGIEIGASGNLAIVGLHFNAEQRNPNSPDFVPFDADGNAIHTAGLKAEMHSGKGNILIEDCWFEWFSGTVILSYRVDAEGNRVYLNNVIVRRNIFNNNYATDSHSIGIYSSYTSILLEENIFDHNGWNIQGDGATKEYGKATMFNHNTYFTNSANTIFRNNIFLRPSSIGNKFTSNSSETNTIRSWNILLDNNFYAEGEIGVSLGGNAPYDFDDGPRWQNVIVVNNVMTAIGRSQPTSRNLGWGIAIDDWNGGLVKNNYLFSWGKTGSYLNTYAIESIGDTTNVIFDSNTVYDIKSDKGVVMFNDEGSSTTGEASHNNVVFSNNEISQTSDNSGSLLGYFINPLILESSHNQFYFGAADSYWFSVSSDLDYSNVDISDPTEVTFDQYVSITNDTTSLAEPPPYYGNYSRTISSFLVDVMKTAEYDEESEISELVELLKQQRKGHWDQRLTSASLNEYFRVGFQ